MTQAANSAPGRGLIVLAVDDERPALDELAFLLRQQDTVAEVFTAQDATTALRQLKQTSGQNVVDAVFLDINMPGLDGLELAGILSAFARPPAVVFVTAHDDRALAAFDLGAVDYLLKPLREDRLTEALRRVLLARRRPAESADTSADEVIPVELGGTTTLVHRSSVAWVEADGDYARLHTSNGSHLVRIPISALESRWADAGFLRVHRSYLVSLRLVTGIRSVGSGLVVCLRASGNLAACELPVSRRHARELKDRLVRGPLQSWSTR
ncbi:DNA-binding response regulator [Rhodococcus sp. 15-725-2-2b]|jgi:DNA-binding LytR/AlgR family response regulator|uniref:LytR/AlgR family response regulator transcription factor n=1 Tax=Nocardiaceae TaxID=85025 RepID=UPI00050BE7FD|nr:MULTISPECIES: LytTR family DNA-binding domain-containing protein [Rhodococcus]AJW40512.1 alginate biosynthesis regulatory protein AlgR [Rhodococcus sp. B7740]OZC72701.1 DNA-binding response regulator [Rhodococcus sp. 06-469-3-2]OZC76806.1 DNA-binding response regulator [Rhodococcus sp. 06-418-5]OZD48928.1 DNA-binding response regulator [Rhodococcus sp. 06-1477-1A]OZE77711.1 DNA-binding response regulator [Rhodococcus sp. 15-725-2-2b]